MIIIAEVPLTIYDNGLRHERFNLMVSIFIFRCADPET